MNGVEEHCGLVLRSGAMPVAHGSGPAKAFPLLIDTLPYHVFPPICFACFIFLGQYKFACKNSEP